MRSKLLLGSVVLGNLLTSEAVFGSEQSSIRQAFLAHSLMESGRPAQQALRTIKEDKEKAVSHQKLHEAVQLIADTERELLRRFMFLLQARANSSTKEEKDQLDSQLRNLQDEYEARINTYMPHKQSKRNEREAGLVCEFMVQNKNNCFTKIVFDKELDIRQLSIQEVPFMALGKNLNLGTFPLIRRN
ncbi:hypothetical protein [Candidatus Bodocaedibacter vickermanii]|uniref:Uncharacterized protein n=1 Tax=Candidatus Bodocaedibacter vickermanii TaxID=2741701 RepID=A0A7L9RT14_9PROT|nr:hypothetical protein CPBP_00454 [Candidatus Paracaedibacteraceae bacterium 'Lake Konstanz']